MTTVALDTIIFLIFCFFIWRNFMKNKEYATQIADRSAIKYHLDILDDSLCLRKIKLKFEKMMPVFYRVYSFDYNSLGSDDRMRGYVVLRNGRLDDIVMSDFEKANVFKESVVSAQVVAKNNSTNNVIAFESDEENS